MDTAIEIARRPDAVTEFIEEVEGTEGDEEARELRLQAIHSLIKFSQRFYIAFFAKELKKLRISGFHYRDKRRVARRILTYEAEARADAEKGPRQDADVDRFDAVLELAGYYEELVDSLQGDLDFGYSTDLANFTEFHEEIYPGWLETVGEWCGVEDDPATQDLLAELAENYRDVAGS